MLTVAPQRARVPLLAFLAALLLVAAPARAEESPTAVVEGINAALLEAMRNADELGFEGRRQLLEPVLTRSFNFPYMARVAVGRHWDELGEEQRARLVETFAHRSVADFAARFSGHSGERFEVTGTEPMPRGTVLVQNRLVRPSGEAIPINYVLRPFDDDSWRVIDVVLEGRYSELARTRAEYTSAIERQGFEGLIQSLEDRIARLRAEAGA